MKIEINKNTIARAFKTIIKKRSFFLIIIFGCMLIFSFDVIYKSAYLELNYMDTSDALNLFDGKRESVLIEKITENLKLREKRINRESGRKYRNFFVYGTTQEEIGAGLSFSQNANGLEGANENSEECFDCIAGGWEKMDEKCPKSIFSEQDFRECLMELSWLQQKDMDLNFIRAGYIEIGKNEIASEKISGSFIRVFIYRTWAADESGNIYLLSQAG